MDVVVAVRCAVEEAVLVVVIVGDERRVGFGVVGNVDLLQFRLRLDRFYSLLLHVAIRGLPHVIIFDDVFQRFPRQLKKERREKKGVRNNHITRLSVLTGTQ